MARRSPTQTSRLRQPHQTAEDKLQAALATLRQQDPARPIVFNATVTEMCRRAGVSRNALYRYHPGVLHELRKLQCRALRAARSREASTDERTQNALLSRHISSLVALVDHYYIAYREASALLARRERELAEVRRSLQMKPALLGS